MKSAVGFRGHRVLGTRQIVLDLLTSKPQSTTELWDLARFKGVGYGQMRHRLIELVAEGKVVKIGGRTATSPTHYRLKGERE